MIVNSWKKDKVFISVICLLSLFIVIFMSYLSRNFIFWGDDYHFAQYQRFESIFDCIFLYNKISIQHGGFYIGLFLNKFLSFQLPLLLNLHPSDFMGFGHGAVKGLFTVIALLLISKFSSIFYKNKYFYIAVFIFLIGFFFYKGYTTNVYRIYYNYYRYFFSLIFFSIFWLFIYKNILSKQKKTDYKKLIPVIISGYIIGTSIEIEFFMSILLSVLIIISKFVKICDFNLNKNFYGAIFGLFLGVLIFTSTAGFQDVIMDRGFSNINITFDDFLDFTCLYLHICFKNQFIYWISFIILLLSSCYFAKRKNEINKIIFPVLMMISVIAVMYSLILCGKTYDEITRDRYYLYHPNIIFLFQFLILFPILILLSYTMRYLIRISKLYTVLVSLILIVSGTMYWFNFIRGNFLLFDDNNFFIKIKRNSYIMEKMLRFYYLKNQIPQIPREIVSRTLDLKTDDNCITFFELTTNYYPKIYKDNSSIKKGFCITDEGLEKFYKDGGAISDEELDNIKFSKLLNKDFILNSTDKQNDIENKIKVDFEFK